MPGVLAEEAIRKLANAIQSESRFLSDESALAVIEAELHRALPQLCQQMIDEELRATKAAEQEAERYRKAYKAANSVLWMAEKYSEGGGSFSVEAYEYASALKTIDAALSQPKESK